MPKTPYLSLFAIVGSLLGASLAAGAQTAPASPAALPSAASAVPGTGHHHHGGRMAKALRGLDLSASQQAQIKTLMTTYRTSRTSATPQTHQQLLAEIENVLTPAQRTQFQTAMQHHRQDGASPASSSPAPSASPSP